MVGVAGKETDRTHLLLELVGQFHAQPLNDGAIFITLLGQGKKEGWNVPLLLHREIFIYIAPSFRPFFRKWPSFSLSILIFLLRHHLCVSKYSPPFKLTPLSRPHSWKLHIIARIEPLSFYLISCSLHPLLLINAPPNHYRATSERGECLIWLHPTWCWWRWWWWRLLLILLLILPHPNPSLRRYNL